LWQNSSLGAWCAETCRRSFVGKYKRNKSYRRAEAITWRSPISMSFYLKKNTPGKNRIMLFFVFFFCLPLKLEVVEQKLI
jgi:hypothetical protein